MSIAFERGKGSRKTNLDNISYILKSPDKDYEVEYVAKILKVKKDSYGTKYYGKFTATNLKTCKSITYDFSNGAPLLKSYVIDLQVFKFVAVNFP